MNILKVSSKVLVLLGLVALASCSGGGGGGSAGGGGCYSNCGGGTPAPGPVYGSHTSPYILASEFVSNLNSVDGTYSTRIELYSNETLRSKTAGQDDWFVIYDAKFAEYKAVSLQYIRSIVYYDYYSSNSKVASEFRNIERNDVIAGKLDGDYYGSNYEVVDRLSSGYFEGRRSGYLYEDGEESTDVSLLAREEEQKRFLAKAAKVSFVYNVSLETSLSLVTLGEKMEKMLSRSNGELSQEDSLALMSDLKQLTGVGLDELQKAAESKEAKEAVLAKVAKQVGTSAENLERKFLPEVLGIQL